MATKGNVHDHLVVREGLVAILNRQSDMTVVGEAGNGHEVLEQWRNHRPDVISLKT